MRRLRILALVASAAVGAAVFACGGISDPTRREGVATISGALTGAGAPPQGARVALVWRVGKDGGFAVGADVPLTIGKFAMTRRS